jgi:YD repeat-containing protein
VDDPQVVISAIEPRRGAAPLLRLLNASATARRVALRWNGAGQALERVDLAGRSLGTAPPAQAGPASARLALRPWELASLRPR